MRGLIDRKGELFAYLDGTQLYTLEGELTGYVRGDFVVDINGTKVWRKVGDAVYTLQGMEPVGFFGADRPQYYS